MIKLISNKKGFSLIELMVVVVILGLMVLGLVTFFTGGAKSWVTGQSQLTAQRNARQAMDRMVREIREGESASGTTTSVTVDIPALGSSDPYSVTYSWTGTPGDHVNREGNPLINNVKKLEFTYPDASKISIILEVAQIFPIIERDITSAIFANLRKRLFLGIMI